MSTDTWGSVFDPERAAEFKNEGSRFVTDGFQAKGRACARPQESLLNVYYCFGGVVG